jgi:hypothetical protein
VAEMLMSGAVRDTGTATLDAKLFNTVAEASVAMAKRTLAGSNAFDVDELLLRSVPLLLTGCLISHLNFDQNLQGPGNDPC